MILWFIGTLWKHRADIVIALELFSALRKTAKEVAQEYIRREFAQQLRKRVIISTVEVGLLLLAWYWCQSYRTLEAQLFASLTLWCITVYNIYEFLFNTIPELAQMHRVLRSKTGYAFRYFLEISIVRELTRLNILFLFLCLGLGFASRAYLGSYFSFTRPWVKLVNF